MITISDLDILEQELSHEEETTWLNNFYRQHGGYIPAKDWIDNVNERHELIHAFLEGRRQVSRDITLEYKDEDRDNKSNKLKSLVAEFLVKFPYISNYLSSNGLEVDDLYASTKNLGSHNVIKISKILTCIYKNCNKVKSEDKSANLRLFNQYLSKLGTEWAKERFDHGTYGITLSTYPIAFALLGHLIVDSGSCFKQCRENDKNKYVLGQTDNTFVVIIKKKDDIIARAWGFLSDDISVFNICNVYFAKYTKEGTVIELLRIFFADLFGIDSDKVRMVEDLIAVSHKLYHNTYGSWSFHHKTRLTKPQLLKTRWRGIYKLIECRCGRHFCHEKDIDIFSVVDNSFICSECMKNVRKCEYTDTYTLKDLVILLPKGSNKPITCKYDIAEQFPRCSCCLLYYEDQAEVALSENVYKCKKCSKQEKYHIHTLTSSMYTDANLA